MDLEFLSCRYSLKYFVPYRALGRAKQSCRGPSKNARAQVPALFPEQAGRGFLPLGSLPRLLAFQDWDTSACLPWNGNPLFFLLWKNPKQKHQQGASLDKGKGNASFHDRWFYLVSASKWMDDGAVKNFLLVWNEHEDNIFCSKIKQKNSKVYRGALGKGNASFHDMLVWFLCELWWCSIYRGE